MRDLRRRVMVCVECGVEDAASSCREGSDVTETLPRARGGEPLANSFRSVLDEPCPARAGVNLAE